jgi:hypothetical protein
VFDLSDQSLVASPPAVVRVDPAGPCRLGEWIPGLGLALVLDRGDAGILWRAEARTGLGRRETWWAGTAEVWLEPWHDATVVHLYVRLDPVDGRRLPPGRVLSWQRALVTRWKARMVRWRYAAEAGRPAGSAVPVAPRRRPAGADPGGPGADPGRLPPWPPTGS